QPPENRRTAGLLAQAIDAYGAVTAPSHQGFHPTAKPATKHRWAAETTGIKPAKAGYSTATVNRRIHPFRHHIATGDSQQGDPSSRPSAALGQSESSP